VELDKAKLRMDNLVFPFHFDLDVESEQKDTFYSL